MKKVFLFIILAISCNMSFAQHALFMEMLENKKVCNGENQLTYFLQTNSFERQNEDHYYHYYAVNGRFYTTCIINQNECYVIYRTDNAKDYNQIKETITSTCAKELAADRSVSYVCNTKRVQDVQIMFPGYSQAEKVYEIYVYQDPHEHEGPYLNTDRILPGSESTPVAKKAKKKHKAKSTAIAAATSPASAPALTKASTSAAQATKSTVPAGLKNTTPNARIAPSVKGAAPAIKVSKPTEAAVKSVTPSVKKS